MGPPLTPRPRGADLAFLREAIELASRGRLSVEPNPPVGCVIVRGGRVVARGWHKAYGGPHAEVEAIRALGSRSRGATAYVSLEPCSTHGKTGPCTEALRAAGIARVVWAVRDPSRENGGRAAAALVKAGIAAVAGALPAEGRAALGEFVRGERARRPWVILKWAMSLDGRIAPAAGTGGPISGALAQRFAHGLRGRVEAVAVGVDTVLVDDPRLTCRLRGGPPHGRAQPVAVVFDSALRIPAHARLLREASSIRPVLLLTARPRTAKARALAAIPGVSVAAAPGRDGRVDLRRALALLYRRGVKRLLVEGGATLSGSFVREGLADQVAVVVAPLLLGGDGAPPALLGTGVLDLVAAPRLSHVRVRRLGHDTLIQGLVVRPAKRR